MPFTSRGAEHMRRASSLARRGAVKRRKRDTGLLCESLKSTRDYQARTLDLIIGVFGSHGVCRAPGLSVDTRAAVSSATSRAQGLPSEQSVLSSGSFSFHVPPEGPARSPGNIPGIERGSANLSFHKTMSVRLRGNKPAPAVK